MNLIEPFPLILYVLSVFHLIYGKTYYGFVLYRFYNLLPHKRYRRCTLKYPYKPAAVFIVCKDNSCILFFMYQLFINTVQLCK